MYRLVSFCKKLANSYKFTTRTQHGQLKRFSEKYSPKKHQATKTTNYCKQNGRLTFKNKKQSNNSFQRKRFSQPKLIFPIFR